MRCLALTWALLLGTGLAGCSHRPMARVRFDEVLIRGDLELEKLNAVELFAHGTAAFGEGDYASATRYFDRLADFFPESPSRAQALHNSGLAWEKLKRWDEAALRFQELFDPRTGKGDVQDAAFRLAETWYHLERYGEAAQLLASLAEHPELGPGKRMEARVQQGICALEAGQTQEAEALLRRALSRWQELPDKDSVDDFYPAQAQFFLGEIYRSHFEALPLDADKTAEQLAADLELKAELLLSAQGHYLRSIRMGNGYWATAAGAQVGAMYETLYHQMMEAPAPRELNPEEASVYRVELRRKIRVLLAKSIGAYERTLEAAERIGTSGVFVERTRESLARMKALLVSDAREDDAAPPPGT